MRLPRARRVKTVNLEAGFARAAYKRPSATFLLPIFQRNHPSWENDAFTQQALIPVIIEWHNAGSLEYALCCG